MYKYLISTYSFLYLLTLFQSDTVYEVKFTICQNKGNTYQFFFVNILIVVYSLPWLNGSYWSDNDINRSAQTIIVKICRRKTNIINFASRTIFSYNHAKGENHYVVFYSDMTPAKR